MKNEDFTAEWSALLKYTACMRGIFDSWEQFFINRNQIEWLSHDKIQDLLVRLRVTLDVLEGFHLFDPLSTLSIAPENSGFPERRYLDQLTYELNGYQSEVGDLFQNTRVLKKSFLDTLFSTVEINVPLLERISKAQSREVLLTSNIFLPYKFNGLEELDSHGGQRRAFLCSWERYVVQNLPVKYFMLFEADDEWSNNSEDVKNLSAILCEETSLVVKLNALARHIDMTNALIHPKWVGRIIFGPVFISHLTEDNHQLQKALDRLSGHDEMLGASRIIYEYVISEGEEPVGRITDSFSRFHNCIQKFAVKERDPEHVERGATHVEKQLFAPHAVIQQLDDDYVKKIGHVLNSTEV